MSVSWVLLSDGCSKEGVMEEQEECPHLDFDWFQPDIISENPDPLDEVLACTQCGYVKWTARQIQRSVDQGILSVK
jgi:hypothetical protein